MAGSEQKGCIGLPPAAGQHFLLDTATLNILGHYRDSPAVKV